MQPHRPIDRRNARLAFLPLIALLLSACAPLTVPDGPRTAACPVWQKLVCYSDRPTLANTHGAPDGACRCSPVLM